MPTLKETLKLERGPLSIAVYDPVLEYPDQGSGGGHYPHIWYRRKAVVGDTSENLVLVANARFNSGTAMWDQIDATSASFIKRFAGGLSETIQGKAAGSGSWTDANWEDGFSIIPGTGTSRRFQTSDIPITFINSTTSADGVNPANNLSLANIVCAKNQVKAWALIRADSGTQTVEEGFGIGNTLTPVGADLRVTLTVLPNASEYIVVATEQIAPVPLIVQVTNKQTSTFDLTMHTDTGSSWTIAGATTTRTGVIVMAQHNT